MQVMREPSGCSLRTDDNGPLGPTADLFAAAGRFSSAHHRTSTISAQPANY